VRARYRLQDDRKKLERTPDHRQARAKKLVKRATSEIDKRETVITLTQSGITILDATTVMVDKLLKELMTINEKDAGQLNHLLEKVRTAEE
jgi:DNA-binding MarR family transcriptional regulator